VAGLHDLIKEKGLKGAIAEFHQGAR
jgi:hypothetical protein